MLGTEALRQRLGAPYVAAKELADVPQAPRQAYIRREDTTVLSAIAVALLTGAGAMAAAYAAMSAGAALTWAVVAALAGGLLCAGLGVWVARSFKRKQEAQLAVQMMLGGQSSGFVSDPRNGKNRRRRF
jgi:hypothetical protein